MQRWDIQALAFKDSSLYLKIPTQIQSASNLTQNGMYFFLPKPNENRLHFPHQTLHEFNMTSPYSQNIEQFDITLEINNSICFNSIHNFMYFKQFDQS